MCELFNMFHIPSHFSQNTFSFSSHINSLDLPLNRPRKAIRFIRFIIDIFHATDYAALFIADETWQEIFPSNSSHSFIWYLQHFNPFSLPPKLQKCSEMLNTAHAQCKNCKKKATNRNEMKNFACLCKLATWWKPRISSHIWILQDGKTNLKNFFLSLYFHFNNSHPQIVCTNSLARLYGWI